MSNLLIPTMPRYWPCGQCGAEGGQVCRTRTGSPAPSHLDRLRSAANFERYGTWVAR